MMLTPLQGTIITFLLIFAVATLCLMAYEKYIDIRHRKAMFKRENSDSEEDRYMLARDRMVTLVDGENVFAIRDLKTISTYERKHGLKCSVTGVPYGPTAEKPGDR